MGIYKITPVNQNDFGFNWEEMREQIDGLCLDQGNKILDEKQRSFFPWVKIQTPLSLRGILDRIDYDRFIIDFQDGCTKITIYNGYIE